MIIIYILIGLVLGILLTLFFVFLKKWWDDFNNPEELTRDDKKEKIMDLFAVKDKIVNDDVERLLETSNATANRYLNELEKENKIIQHGKVGAGVFYSKK